MSGEHAPAVTAAVKTISAHTDPDSAQRQEGQVRIATTPGREGTSCGNGSEVRADDREYGCQRIASFELDNLLCQQIDRRLAVTRGDRVYFSTPCDN